MSNYLFLKALKCFFFINLQFDEVIEISLGSIFSPPRISSVPARSLSIICHGGVFEYSIN